jgi:hypothetical protein
MIRKCARARIFSKMALSKSPRESDVVNEYVVTLEGQVLIDVERLGDVDTAVTETERPFDRVG